MDAVASMTRISGCGCPMRVPGRLHLGTLTLERLRILGDHRVLEMEAAASTTPIAEADCPVRVRGRVPLETLETLSL